MVIPRWARNCRPSRKPAVRFSNGRTMRTLRLCGESLSERETRNLFHSLLRAPGNHGTHTAGRACFVEARLEVLVDLWVLIFVLDLRAAVFDAYLDRLVVTERDEIVTPAIPAQRQVTSGIGAGVEVLVKPLGRRNHDAPRFPVHPGRFPVFGPEQ